MRLALKNWTRLSLRLISSRKQKQASTSWLGSGSPEPRTIIHPLTGGAMKSFSSPANPSSHEHGLALCSPRADWTALRLRLLIASQEEGRLIKPVAWAGMKEVKSFASADCRN